MSENTRNFYEQNRSNFDKVEKAPEGLWDKISQDLEGERKLSANKKEEPRRKVKSKWASFRSWTRIAAMFLLFFGIGFTAALFFVSRQSSADQRMADKYPEMYEAERYYTDNIELVKAEIIKSKDVDEALIKEFIKEHELLDKVYLELKSILQESTNSDKVIELMLQNLQMRMEVLGKQKRILENIRSIKSGKNDTKTL